MRPICNNNKAESAERVGTERKRPKSTSFNGFAFARFCVRCLRAPPCEHQQRQQERRVRDEEIHEPQFLKLGGDNAQRPAAVNACKPAGEQISQHLQGAVFSTLFDFVSSDVALRINGNILSIFVIKIVFIGLNLLPLLFATRTSSKSSTAKQYPPCKIEKVLALRACCIGGLGLASYYYEVTAGPSKDNTTAAPTFVVNSYELPRMGYVVLGDKCLISLVEWVYYCCCGGMSSSHCQSNCRLLLFRAEQKSSGFVVVGMHAGEDHANNKRARTQGEYEQKH